MALQATLISWHGQLMSERESRPVDFLLWVSWTLVKWFRKLSQINWLCGLVTWTLTRVMDTHKRESGLFVLVFVFDMHQLLEYASNICCPVENEFIIILIIYLSSPGQCFQEKRSYGKTEKANITISWLTDAVHSRQVQYTMNRLLRHMADNFEDSIDNCPWTTCVIYEVNKCIK